MQREVLPCSHRVWFNRVKLVHHPFTTNVVYSSLWTVPLPKLERTWEISGVIAEWWGWLCSMQSGHQRILRLSVCTISWSGNLQPKGCFGCLPAPRSSACSEQFQLCVKTIIVIKSHAPLPQPVPSMEQMGRGLEPARAFPPTQAHNWPNMCREYFFVFPIGSSLLLPRCQWQAAAGKWWAGGWSVGREKIFFSSAFCLPLVTHLRCRGSLAESRHRRFLLSLNLQDQIWAWLVGWVGYTGCPKPCENPHEVTEQQLPTCKPVTWQVWLCGSCCWCWWCWQWCAGVTDCLGQHKCRADTAPERTILEGHPWAHPSFQQAGVEAGPGFVGWSLGASLCHIPASPLSKKQNGTCWICASHRDTLLKGGPRDLMFYFIFSNGW